MDTSLEFLLVSLLVFALVSPIAGFFLLRSMADEQEAERQRHFKEIYDREMRKVNRDCAYLFKIQQAKHRRHVRDGRYSQLMKK